MVGGSGVGDEVIPWMDGAGMGWVRESGEGQTY